MCSVPIIALAIYFQLIVNRPPIALPPGGHASPQRKVFMEEKYAVDRAVLEKHSSLDDVQSSSGSFEGAPKIAFLFEIQKHLKSPSIWEAFFEDAPHGTYSIYFSRTKVPDNATDSVPLPLAKYGAKSVPHMETQWCALYGGQVGLIYHALRDPNNVQFMILSDSTAPIKSFKYIYGELAQRTPHTSKFCLATPALYVKARDHYTTTLFAHPCPFRSFFHQYNPKIRKHDTWIVVSREHAQTMVRRSVRDLDTFFDAWRQAAPDWYHTGEGCSCEGTALLTIMEELEAVGRSSGDYYEDLKRANVDAQCVTMVSWRNCFVGSHLNTDSISKALHLIWKYAMPEFWRVLTEENVDWLNSDIKKALNGFPQEFYEVELDYLKALAAEGFMFMRKVPPDSQVIMPDGSFKPMTEVLPTIWAQVDEDQARASPWSSIDASWQVPGFPGYQGKDSIEPS